MYFDKSFWDSLQRHRLLVILDEIHHCSGDSAANANNWGHEVLSQIQHYASYTLALSGTPWRTDNVPIVLSNYIFPDGEIKCDYVYGLHDAIVDNVCRKPKIVLINSNNLVFLSEKKVEYFSSFSEFLNGRFASYRSIVSHPDTMQYVIKAGCEKFRQIRKINSDAGGLIVASSIEHAYKLLNIVEKEFDQTATIVTHHNKDALSKIELFRQGATEWIVSVGMISEGTDIPRLQVCCHLSTVKTELYFRQILGRILRVNQSENQEAWLYTLATDELTLYSKRLANDLPGDYQVLHELSEEKKLSIECTFSTLGYTQQKKGIWTLGKNEHEIEFSDGEILNLSNSGNTHKLKVDEMYQLVIDAFLFNDV